MLLIGGLQSGRHPESRLTAEFALLSLQGPDTFPTAFGYSSSCLVAATNAFPPKDSVSHETPVHESIEFAVAAVSRPIR